MNKNIDKYNIQPLLDAIESADILVVNGSPYLSGGGMASEVIGDPYNEVLTIKWHDDDGQIHYEIFTESALGSARIDRNMIYLKECEGENAFIEVYRLNPKDMSEFSPKNQE